MAFPIDWTHRNGRWTRKPKPKHAVGVDCKKLIKRETILTKLKERAK